MTIGREMRDRCRYFGECGGCTLQDQEYGAQLHWKESRLRALLGRVMPVGSIRWLPTVSAPPWGYRHRARFSVRLGSQPDDVLLGFHHVRKRGEIVGLEDCPVMASCLAELLPDVKTCLQALDMKSLIPQVDMIAAENGRALVFRLRRSLPDHDRAYITDFSRKFETHIFLQEQGPDSIRPLRDGECFQPRYRLPEFDLTFSYRVTQFAQVNPEINRRMVHAVIAELQPKEGELIADLFCGVGNFALAAARRGAHVSGWEWSASSVVCANDNAVRNGLQEQATFHQDNLDRASQEKCRRLARFEKFILDPPRSGAEALMHCLPSDGKRRIVYVSCQPKTLARDGAILVNQKGYQLIAAGLIDMFPHTDHMEALAVFERDE